MTFAFQVGELYFILSIHPNCHKITADFFMMNLTISQGHVPIYGVAQKYKS